jgi:hypothetical protein
MPKRQKKRYKKFVRKVKNIAMKLTNLQTQVINENKHLNWSDDECAFVALTMYGLQGNPGTEGSALVGARGRTDDLAVLMQDAQFGRQDSCKWHFESCTMDVYIKNPTNIKVILEIYEIINRMDPADVVSDNTVESLYESGFAEALPVNDTGVGNFRQYMAANQIGTTPFNNAAFCRKWRVLKKTRVELGGGEITALQMRDPKNRDYTFKDTKNKVAIPGVTKGFLFQAFGEPYKVGDNPVVNYQGQLHFTCNRAYNYSRSGLLES